MKIGILGTGDVGQTLANAFAKKGHDVVVGTREPAGRKLDDWSGRIVSFADAAKHGEIVVLAVLGSGLDAVLDAAGPQSLAGKLVVDATNALDFSKGAPPTLLWGLDDSAGERVQRKAPAAKVVKAFNTVPNARMVDPLPSSRLMICGDDPAAKKQVESLVRDFGWAGVVDVGGIRESRWLEALVPLWVRAGVALGRWDHVLEPRYD